jgi:hypothetical protein
MNATNAFSPLPCRENDAAASWSNRGWLALKIPRTVMRAKPHKVIHLVLASKDLRVQLSATSSGICFLTDLYEDR